MPETKNPVVVMQTSLGAIEIELDAARAPISTKNFLQYVTDGFFDGTIFHRVISNFMIQGGGYTTTFQHKNTRPPIKNESSNGLSNLRGTIAMARTNAPDSATAQFFINVLDNKGLDRNPANPGGYAVFGRVIAGMEVVDKIRALKTGRSNTPAGPMQDVPVEAVEIQSVRVKEL
jgi:cyclophilin family peptidyl-prolyl cis-trans isomerase